MEIIKQTAAHTVNPVGNGSDHNLTGNITTILNGIIAVLGLACVVVMIIGGVNYMTSAGDTAKVEKGKKTILYGAIGLIICVLAFAIVNFVINNLLDQPDSPSNYTTAQDCNDAGFKWQNGKCGN